MPIISPIAISPMKIRGQSWSSYWATLISATVEDAAPTHVVLTFPTSQTSLGASDFTITGFTISSASWAGSVLTLVLSYAVTYYSGNLTITFGKTGETATVTNNVAIANTVMWFDSTDLTTITKDGSNLVSQWNDKSGNARHLKQATGSAQPIYSSDGLTFDGSGDYMDTDVFDAIDVPVFVYMVYKELSFTSNDALFSLHGGGDPPSFIDQHTASPLLNAFSSTRLDVTGAGVDNWSIGRFLFNETESTFQVNDLTKVSGNVGTFKPFTAFMLALRSDSAGTKANILVKEIIIRNAVDNAATQTAIYNYLADKYDFPWTYSEESIFDNAKLVLTYDDGKSSVYTNGFPLFQTKGITATFYVPSANVGTDGYVTWAQLQEMNAAGMDIQCHTQNHVYLTALSTAEIYAELDGEAADFVANSLPAPTQHAYPYGYYSRTVMDAVATRRNTGRTTGVGYTYPTSNRYVINSPQMAPSQRTLAQLEAMIDQIVANKTALVLFDHYIGEESGMTVENLGALIDYALAAGVDIITMSQLDLLLD